MPASFVDEAVRVQTCPVERGHVHFHHPLTWHGSPANKSGRPRRAVALHFMIERAVFDESKRGLHPMGSSWHLVMAKRCAANISPSFGRSE